jgi:Tetracyclin repressor-like, C-terminal domain
LARLVFRPSVPGPAAGSLTSTKPSIAPSRPLAGWSKPTSPAKPFGIIGILRDAGFSDRDAATHFRTIGYHLTGAALDETAGYAKGPSAAEPVSNETIAADFRNLAAAAPFFQPAHFQVTFEAGLELLLAEIARAHRERFP